jgi:hypothetical protein
MSRARHLAASSVAGGDDTGWFEKLYAEGDAGTAVVIAFATDEDNPPRDPAMMPWPLTRAELAVAAGPLRTRRIERFMGNVPALPRWRAEFVRDREA